jgi:hypothetical protein
MRNATPGLYHEPTDISMQMCPFCPIAGQLAQLKHCGSPWPEWTPQNDVDDKQRSQLAARSPRIRLAKSAHIRLRLPCKHAIPLQPWTKASVGPVPERQTTQVRSGGDTVHDSEGCCQSRRASGQTSSYRTA